MLSPLPFKNGQQSNKQQQYRQSYKDGTYVSGEKGKEQLKNKMKGENGQWESEILRVLLDIQWQQGKKNPQAVQKA